MPVSEVYNMDCLDYMKTIPDKFFDLCIADPPYGINVTSRGWVAKHASDISGENNKWDKQTPPKEVFEEIFRVSKQQIIWGANYFISKMPQQDTQCWFLWDKKIPDSLSFAQFEMAWSGLKMGCKKFDFQPSRQKHRIHVTQKPVELYSWLLDISKIGGVKYSIRFSEVAAAG